MVVFDEVRIIGIDEKASQNSTANDDCFDIKLILAPFASTDWACYFNERWKQHLYIKKADARVSGTRLSIRCSPEELEINHLVELKKIIADANSHYRHYLEGKEEVEQHKVARELSNLEKIADLQKRLKFD